MERDENQKKVGVVILLSDKTNLKIKSITNGGIILGICKWILLYMFTYNDYNYIYI